ncbi:MAG: FG-GAP repeat protein [Roseomonas sp.]|nr:FG-GAP repeat protein [Roseomonas sp.]
MSGTIAPIDLVTIAAGTGGFVINGQDGDYPFDAVSGGDRSGWSVASAGDVNGDGFVDIIIGAPFAYAANNATVKAGESYVVFGKASGWGAPVDLAAIAGGTGGFVLRGQDENDYAGWSVASAGDVNGDGFADLIIGAHGGDGPHQRDMAR